MKVKHKFYSKCRRTTKKKLGIDADKISVELRNLSLYTHGEMKVFPGVWVCKIFADVYM